MTMSAMAALERSVPELILLDYEMPEVNGKETLEVIRTQKNYCDIPVVFLTAVADKQKISEVLALQPQGYLLKPVEQQKLLNYLEDFFLTH